MHNKVIISLVLFFLLSDLSVSATDFSLDGMWDVAMGEELPKEYLSVCPVPGIASQASVPIAADLHHFASEVDYDWVWYRKRFVVSSNASQAFLMLRAKYNAKVWLNGNEIGFDDSCAYSHARFDITNALNVDGENEIVVRVGSWRTASFPSKENKSEWWRTSRCPGIIDNVWIELSDDIAAQRLEALPDVETGVVRFRATVSSLKTKKIKSCFVVKNSDDVELFRSPISKQKLCKGESASFESVVDASSLELWSAGPNGRPVLYKVELVADDKILKSIRFGYREVKINGRDVIMNGKKVHFAAENIAFARTLISWADYVMNPEWVRFFLRTVIHEYGFNFLRMHLGHAPSFWYDIADEEGILIQDEWCFMHEKDPVGDDLLQTEKEFTAWVKENINHPSIIGWDMENEGDVELKELSARLKEYDPTRMWSEDDFDTQHRYEYSENILPEPYCVVSNDKPTTVLESCRLWINPSRELEPAESFKTSRTATSWGVYYYTPEILEQLQADIHADQGTYFRSIEVQAWAPFALLSGTINGHDFFRGDIGKVLEPQKNLLVLKSFNCPVGASLQMLQAREWYKERVSYHPGSKFSKNVVVWNDQSKEESFSVTVSLRDSIGAIVASDSFSVIVPAGRSVTMNNMFSLDLPYVSGYYDVLISIDDGLNKYEGPSRRIAVGARPQDLSQPFDGAVCVLDHFLSGISVMQKKYIIEHTRFNPIDKIAKGGKVVNYTVYSSESAKTYKLSIGEFGEIISKDVVKDKSSGWLQHAF